jgi:hypothetical protein
LLLLDRGISKSFKKLPIRRRRLAYPSRTILGEAAPQFSQLLGILLRNWRMRAL